MGKKLLELPKFLISDNKANRSELSKGFKITLIS